MRCVLLVFVLPFGLMGCNDDSPSAPADQTANVAGHWVGTVRFTAGGDSGEEPFQMTLTQEGDLVNGTYSATRFHGSIDGETNESEFAGVFEFRSTAQGEPCQGEFDVEGPAGGNSVTWTSPRIVGALPCVNTPRDIRISVTRN